MPSKLLYLHGFISSPASIKAQQTQAWLAERGLAERLICPALPYSPAAAAQVIEDTVNSLKGQPFAVAGSSLGGFYATWVAEQWGCRAVLINPSVRPWHSLGSRLGWHQNMYTGERFELGPQHVDELRALQQHNYHPERYWLLAETGDEVLDYREAVARYPLARQSILPGGDHSFSQWQAMLPQVLTWLGVVDEC